MNDCMACAIAQKQRHARGISETPSIDECPVHGFTPEQRAAIEKAATTETDLFRTGIDRECRDVARRIYREAVKRNDGPRSLPRASVYFAAVSTLRRLAMRLHRSYEDACNREQSDSELRRERKTEARVLQLCHELGVSVRFNSDPRGGPVKIPCAKENANGWEGDCIVIPFADAKEYDRK